MPTLKKEEIILNDVRRLFIHNRSYPKCFQTNSDVMAICDLLSDSYASSLSKPEIKYLFSLYTLLLCGLSALNNQVSPDKIKTRFSRFLNMDGTSTWSFIIKMIKLMLNKDLELLKNLLNETDYDTFKKKHAHFEKTIMIELKKFYE